MGERNVCQMNTNSIKREGYGTIYCELPNSSVNDDKNVPEQKAMTVDTAGYEEAFEDTDRGPNVRPASEIVEIIEEKAR